MKPLKNKVSITLDEDVIERIKQLAEIDDRSFSQYINMVFKEHLPTMNKVFKGNQTLGYYLFKTLNPVESFSPLPLPCHITQLAFSAEYSYQST